MASSTSSTATTAATTLTESTETETEASETLRLKLKKTPEKKKIQWTEETVDNEGLGKKKSKVCCQYKKPRADLDESSDSDSDCPGH